VPRRFRYPFDWRAVIGAAMGREDPMRSGEVLDQLIERDRALEDHLSNLDPAPAATVNPAATVVTETLFGQAAAVGTSALYARGDHTHGSPLLANTVTSEIGYGQSPAAGITGAASRGDHTHGTPALGNTVATELSFGQSASAGFSLTPARSDHTHGTPSHGAVNHVHPSVSVYRVGNIFVAHGVETSVVWNTSRHNTGGMWDGAGTLIAPIAGVYLVWCVNFWQVYPTGQRTHHIKVNGLTIIDDHQILESVKAPPGSPGAPAGGWGIIGMSSARTWRCNANDVVNVTVLQQNVDGVGLDLDGSTGAAFGIEAGLTFLSAA